MAEPTPVWRIEVDFRTSKPVADEVFERVLRVIGDRLVGACLTLEEGEDA